MLETRLEQAIRAAGVPIVGVSIGDRTNKATWLVQPPSLQSLAQPIINGFDPNDPTLIAAENDAKAAQIDNDLLVQAVAQLDYEERQKLAVKAGQTLRTAAECKARVKAIYRSLLG